MMKLVYWFIYNPPVNYFLRSLCKLLAPLTGFQLPPSGIIKIELTERRSFRMATNQTSYVTNKLYYEGAQAFEYTHIFERLITQCRTFVDVGANTGYYSLLAATSGPTQVYAFEPSPGPLYYLRLNVNLNHFSRQIRVFDVALSDEQGSLTFYSTVNEKYNLEHHLGGIGSLIPSRKNQKPIKVSSIKLDQFVEEEKMNYVDLIKIDTEGSEHLILKGATETIKKYQPIIICETLFNKIESKLEQEMSKHGYVFLNHTPKGLKQVQTLQRQEDDGVRDCFFVPPSKLDWVKSWIIT
ncbi:MAG: FkbM family methyltransferase [Bacteroidota bacterium]